MNKSHFAMTAIVIVAIIAFAVVFMLVGCAGGQASSASSASASAASSAQGQAKLAIIHTNDTHGYDQASDSSLGLAAVAKMKEDYKDQGYDVLLLHCFRCEGCANNRLLGFPGASALPG